MKDSTNRKRHCTDVMSNCFHKMVEDIKKFLIGVPWVQYRISKTIVLKEGPIVSKSLRRFVRNESASNI